MEYVFPPPERPALAVSGTHTRFPVRRIYCVGRNYADHAREMGAIDQADGREPPFFFSKPADALVAAASDSTGNGALEIPYPPATADFQHEVELVVAIGRGGADIRASDAPGHVFGYAVGLDLTRRDLQSRAKQKGQPWDLGKGFDASAPVGLLRPVAEVGHPAQGAISLRVNGAVRQSGDLATMTWSVPEVVAALSRYVTLAPGDLIFTGTPAGVGPVVRGDELVGRVEGIGELRVRIV